MQMTLFARRSIVATLTLTLLIAVNSAARPSKSESEAQFESWLKQTEPLLESPENAPAGVPLIVVRANVTRNGQQTKWELSSSNDSFERNEQLIRLLALMREANVFAKKNLAQVNQSGNFLISVEDAKSTFQARLGPKELEESLPAQNLLKLFEVYATTDSTKAMARNVHPTIDASSPTALGIAAVEQAHSEPANK